MRPYGTELRMEMLRRTFRGKCVISKRRKNGVFFRPKHNQGENPSNGTFPFFDSTFFSQIRENGSKYSPYGHLDGMDITQLKYYNVSISCKRYGLFILYNDSFKVYFQSFVYWISNLYTFYDIQIPIWQNWTSSNVYFYLFLFFIRIYFNRTVNVNF